MAKHPLQASGQISMSELILELSGTSTTLSFLNISLSGLCWGIPKLNDGTTPNINTLNTLTNIQTAPFAMSDWYSYNHALVNPYITGPFGNTGTTTGMSAMGFTQSYYIIADYGVCWNTAGSPTISDSHNSGGGGPYTAVSGSYTPWTISPLTVGVLYYIRPYVYRSSGGPGVSGYTYGSQSTYTPIGVTTTTTTVVLYNYSCEGYTCACSAPSSYNYQSTNPSLTAGYYMYGSSVVRVVSSGGGGDDGPIIGLVGPYASCALACASIATTTTTSTTQPPTTTTTTTCTFNVNTTEQPTYYDSTRAISGGGFDCNSGTVTKIGICWNIYGSPTVADSKYEQAGTYTSYNLGWGSYPMGTLTNGYTYYVKAYAYNGSYFYGPTQTYTHNIPTTTTSTTAPATTTTSTTVAK